MSILKTTSDGSTSIAAKIISKQRLELRRPRLGLRKPGDPTLSSNPSGRPKARHVGEVFAGGLLAIFTYDLRPSCLVSRGTIWRAFRALSKARRITPRYHGRKLTETDILTLKATLSLPSIWRQYKGAGPSTRNTLDIQAYTIDNFGLIGPPIDYEDAIREARKENQSESSAN